MPTAEDSFFVEVLEIHMAWGEYPKRQSPTRPERYGEGYIPIPRPFARQFNIFNSNKQTANIEYRVSTLNGCSVEGCLLAQGSSDSSDVLAKQFSLKGDLTAIGRWYASVNAKPGGYVRVCFTSPTSLTLQYYDVDSTCE